MRSPSAVRELLLIRAEVTAVASRLHLPAEPIIHTLTVALLLLLQNDARALVKHQRWRDLPKAVKDHVKADVSALAVQVPLERRSLCGYARAVAAAALPAAHPPSSFFSSVLLDLQLVPALSGSHPAPRTAAAQAIAKLGKIEVPEGAWPELVDGLVGAAMSDAVPEATKTASLTAIGFLCEEIVREPHCRSRLQQVTAAQLIQLPAAAQAQHGRTAG